MKRIWQPTPWFWIFFLAIAVQAHVPIFEPERSSKAPVDFSFLSPLHLDRYGPETSLVIESSLTRPLEVDVFRVGVHNASLLFGFATTPACMETVNVFPTLTLVGQNLPPSAGDQSTVELPFPLPKGYRAVTAVERPGPEKRRIFRYGNYSWWMSPSYTNTCHGGSNLVTDATAAAAAGCDYSFTVRVPVDTPGPVWWVVWNATGRDVSTVLGFRERVDLIREALPHLPSSNTPIQHPCTPPPEGEYEVISE